MMKDIIHNNFEEIWDRGWLIINFSNFDCAKCHRKFLYVPKRIFKSYLSNGILRCSHNNIYFLAITFLVFNTSGHNPTFVVPNATVVVPNAIEASYVLSFEFYNSDYISLFRTLNSITLMNKNTKQKKNRNIIEVNGIWT